MIGKWNSTLKIMVFTILLSMLVFLILKIALVDGGSYFSLIVLMLFALLILGLFLKSDSRYKIIAWSMIWTAGMYLLFGTVAFFFLFTYGPHGIC
jgi:hypothetical protein